MQFACMSEVEDVDTRGPLIQPWAAQLCQEGVLHPIKAVHGDLELRELHRAKGRRSHLHLLRCLHPLDIHAH